MGMYTEISFRANLKKDTPEAVLAVLEHIVNPFEVAVPDSLPDHEFFNCHRWDNLTGASSYFPSVYRSVLLRSTLPAPYETHVVAIYGNLKNYDGEIGKFFDWIDPYVDATQGEYLGYSLHEEAVYEDEGGPTNFFKQ